MILGDLHTAAASLHRAYLDALDLGERELAAEIKRAVEVVGVAIGKLVTAGKKAS